jgi:hypothetical protein
VVGALTVVLDILVVGLALLVWQEKTPVSIISCTRVARWCVWLDPGGDERGTNALTYYYKHSAEPHSCEW